MVFYFVCSMKGLAHFSSTFGVRRILDTGTKLLTRSKKKDELAQLKAVVWFSSLGSDSPNENAQVSESTNEVKIIHCLNTLTAEEMRKLKNIPNRLSEFICKYREENGLFSTLNDLQKVKQIGPKNFKTICKQFTAESDSRTNNVTDEDYIHKYISPELTSSIIRSALTVTSLEVSIDCVCFSTMSRDMKVIDWNHVILKGSNLVKQTPAQILDQAVHVLNHLPKSSIVLLENRLSRKRTPSYINYLLFLGRLEMALQTLINEDLCKNGQHKVFYIKDSFVINKFELRVGGERVSGQNIIQKMQDDQFPHKLSIVPKFWYRFNRLESDVLREKYTNCLLMTHAFCQQVFVDKSL